MSICARENSSQPASFFRAGSSLTSLLDTTEMSEFILIHFLNIKTKQTQRILQNPEGKLGNFVTAQIVIEFIILL